MSIIVTNKKEGFYMETVDNNLSTMQTKLNERVSNLEATLKDAIISKEVTTMLLCLECAKNLDFNRIHRDKNLNFEGNMPGLYRNTLSNLLISRESFNTFIGLLNSDEYLKGFYKDDDFTSDEYFLTLGQGIVLEVSLTEIKRTKETVFGILAYEVPKKISIAVNTQTDKWPVMKILAEDGTVYRTNVTNEYVQYNGRNLDDVITPISIDVLTQRFVETAQKPKDDKTFKVTPIAIENK